MQFFGQWLNVIEVELFISSHHHYRLILKIRPTIITVTKNNMDEFSSSCFGSPLASNYYQFPKKQLLRPSTSYLPYLILCVLTPCINKFSFLFFAAQLIAHRSWLHFMWYFFLSIKNYVSGFDPATL